RYVTLGLPRPESSPERDEPRSLDGDAPARTAPRAPEGVRRRQRRATRRRPPPPVALQDAAVGVVRFLDLGEDDAHGFRPSLEDPHRRLRHGRHEPPAPVQGSSREQFDGDVRHNVLQCTFVALHEKIFRYMKQGAVVDVVVLGEPLVEFSADRPLTEAEDFRLSFSGDALNVSVAAAASGAAVALVTRVGRDELGRRLIRFAADRGVDTRWMAEDAGATGAYVVGADPSGEREFCYMRYGSAASRMTPADVDRSPIGEARVVVLSGITAAISDTCAHAVRHAAEAASGRVVYDPNYRPRLTGPEAARAVLADVAPHAALVKISAPGDSGALLGLTDPREVIRACLDLGARAVAVTCGERGVVLGEPDAEPIEIPAVPAEKVVDQTGAGDNWIGALSAWLARGEPLHQAVRAGVAAASISLAGQGGTGRVATREEITRLIA